MDELVERLKCGIHFRAGVIPSNPEPNTAYGEPDLVDAARVMSEAAARIQELETSLAEAEGRVIAEVVAWLRGSLIKHYEEPSEWELAVETYATALETGEWKK